jgi:histidinol-phosphate aminotransferase
VFDPARDGRDRSARPTSNLGDVPDAARGPLLRRALDALPRYRAGAAVVASSTGLTPHKLASNENPFSPLPGVMAAAQEGLATLNRYPDYGSTALLDALAEATKLTRDQLAVGTGSVALLQHLVQITCDDGDEVVYAWRSFEAYPIVTQITGAVPVAVPLTADHHHDIDAMIAAVGPRTRLMLLCSPNNPTGTLVAAADVQRLLAQVPPSVLVVLDEAYIEFVESGQRPDVAALMREHRNLVVLRTFSKAYGLAALRVGYAMGDAEVMDALRAVALPFGVSSVAQSAARASLSAPAQSDLSMRVATVVQERERLVQALTALGAPVASAHGNFVWLPVAASAVALGRAFDARSLSVRVFADEGVRVTIGSREANDRVIAVVADHLDGG